MRPGGIELKDVKGKPPWGERCLSKCHPSVSIKGTSRTGAKIADYEKDKGPDKYPSPSSVRDSLEITETFTR